MKQLLSPEDVQRFSDLYSRFMTAPPEEIVRLGNLYLERLLSFNRVVPLISRAQEQQKLAVQLFLSSFAALEFLPQQQGITLCDLGSGGGFPAIPLKIARPETKWFFVEAKQRKCAFLESVVFDLKLSDVKVVCRRLEEFTVPEGSIFSIVTARAGPSIDSVLQWVGHVPSVVEIILFLSAEDAAAASTKYKNQLFYVAERKKIDELPEVGGLTLVLLKKSGT